MSRPFDETREMAQDTLSGMNRQLTILRRMHKKYTEHGAVNAAAETQGKIDTLEAGIAYEETTFRMAFR